MQTTPLYCLILKPFPLLFLVVGCSSFEDTQSIGQAAPPIEDEPTRFEANTTEEPSFEEDPDIGKCWYLIGDKNEDGVLDEMDCIGDDGLDGADGDDGTNGSDGQDGTNGANGADGQDGADGADGQDGADGADGQDGADGANGATGADGEDGDDGANGDDGEDGLDGDDGANGADGTDGENGEDGMSCYDPLLVLGLPQGDLDGNGEINEDDCYGDNGQHCYEGIGDRDGNGLVDVLDCIGEDGADGQDGQDGANGQDGASAQLSLGDRLRIVPSPQTLYGGEAWDYTNPTGRAVAVNLSIQLTTGNKDLVKDVVKEVGRQVGGTIFQEGYSDFLWTQSSGNTTIAHAWISLNRDRMQNNAVKYNALIDRINNVENLLLNSDNPMSGFNTLRDEVKASIYVKRAGEAEFDEGTGCFDLGDEVEHLYSASSGGWIDQRFTTTVFLPAGAQLRVRAWNGNTSSNGLGPQHPCDGKNDWGNDRVIITKQSHLIAIGN